MCVSVCGLIDQEFLPCILLLMDKANKGEACFNIPFENEHKIAIKGGWEALTQTHSNPIDSASIRDQSKCVHDKHTGEVPKIQQHFNAYV